MQNLLIIIGALMFLAILWIVTYKNILNHLVSEVNKSDKGVRAQLFKLHDKLPYLLEILKENAVFGNNNGQNIVRLRSGLMEKNLETVALFALYDQIYIYLEEIFTLDKKELKVNIGFLESRGELQDIHDSLRVTIKKYNQDVNKYNSKLIKFPGNFVGGLFRMHSLRELNR